MLPHEFQKALAQILLDGGCVLREAAPLIARSLCMGKGMRNECEATKWVACFWCDTSAAAAKRESAPASDIVCAGHCKAMNRTSNVMPACTL